LSHTFAALPFMEQCLGVDLASVIVHYLMHCYDIDPLLYSG